MKFKLELPINKPRADVWKAFDNAENIKKWQPTLVSFEPVSGTPGQPGAVSKLTYKEGNRDLILIEKITRRDEPRVLTAFMKAILPITRSEIFLSNKAKIKLSG